MEHLYDVDDFCKKVVTQRNFYAHNHYNNNISEFNYHYFITVLKLIYEISLYSWLNLNEDQKINLSKKYKLITKRYLVSLKADLGR